MMNLNKKIVASLFVTLSITAGCLNASAQQLAKDLFVNMPDTVCPLLTPINRADCIDFLESNMKAKVENRFNKISEMIELGNDYIQVQLSPQSTWQMKLLSVNDSTQIICTISTACAPVCDSDIRFYSDKWVLLPTSTYLPSQPEMNNFFIQPDSTSAVKYEEAILSADVLLMKADLSKENDNLIFTFSTADYLEKETAEKLNPFIRRSIIYYWNQGQYLALQASINE